MNVEQIHVTLKQHAKILLALLRVHVMEAMLEMVSFVKVGKSDKLYIMFLATIVLKEIKIHVRMHFRINAPI